MYKILIPFGALIALGFALSCLIYFSSVNSQDRAKVQEEKAARNTYEMPKFVPAVWVRGH